MERIFNQLVISMILALVCECRPPARKFHEIVASDNFEPQGVWGAVDIYGSGRLFHGERRHKASPSKFWGGTITPRFCSDTIHKGAFGLRGRNIVIEGMNIRAKESFSHVATHPMDFAPQLRSATIVKIVVE
jgi:hypothetical protein